MPEQPEKLDLRSQDISAEKREELLRPTASNDGWNLITHGERGGCGSPYCPDCTAASGWATLGVSCRVRASEAGSTRRRTGRRMHNDATFGSYGCCASGVSSRSSR